MGEEEDQFSLADQIRATPERSLKKEKKKKNRRSTDSEALSADSGRMEEDEIPPPLPPKRITPSPKTGLSLETQPSLEEEEEAVPVKNSQGEQPQAPRREKQSRPWPAPCFHCSQCCWGETDQQDSEQNECERHVLNSTEVSHNGAGSKD